MHQPRTVTDLPDGYIEDRFLRLSERKIFWGMNIVSVPILFLAGAVFLLWLWVYHRLLGGPLVVNSLPENIGTMMWLALFAAMLIVHELFHGVAIQYYGHRARYGVKWMVLYATTDRGLFWKPQFVVVALMPLIGISAIFVVSALWLPVGMAVAMAAVAAANAAGSIGDLWMVWTVRHYPPNILIRDEADGMRIFVPQ